MNGCLSVSERKFERRRQKQAVETTLDLLSVVEGEEMTSQRGLAARLGVALGLTNAILKRCSRKGLLKIREAPARRYAYYLTPEGFAEKGRLTAEYLSTSLRFFRRARDEYSEAADYCVKRGWKRVALCGSGELCEIALLAMSASRLETVAVVDPECNTETMFETPVVRSVLEAEISAPVDALIITESRKPQKVYGTIRAAYPALPIITPSLLRVRRQAQRAEQEHGRV